MQDPAVLATSFLKVRATLSFVQKFCNDVDISFILEYALINRVRGPYQEIFVRTFKACGPDAVKSIRHELQNKYFPYLTFKAYGPNAVKPMRLERQNKYFPYGPRSRLIRALLYTHINKLIFQ